jgi:hypothetical protein
MPTPLTSASSVEPRGEGMPHSTSDEAMSAPPLKTDPKYGYFPRWPQNGDDWVHPEDVAAARSMIPSGRIFRRDGTSGRYAVLHYGSAKLRVLPALWQEVMIEELEIGDWVEVVPRGMQNAPRNGMIREVLWDDLAQAIRYQISQNGQPIETLYAREDLQPIEPVT